jgi:ATP-dependent Lon protease
MVGVLTQKNSETVEPSFDDLYSIGTLARVVKVIRLGPTIGATAYFAFVNTVYFAGKRPRRRRLGALRGPRDHQ